MATSDTLMFDIWRRMIRDEDEIGEVWCGVRQTYVC